jgi:hypothetical protein
LIKFYYYTSIICILFISSLKAQGFESGAFGAPVFKYTRLANQPALMIGGKGGWIINKRLVLGAGIYALSSNVKSPYVIEQTGQSLMFNFNYGGLEFEFLLLPQSKFNLTFDMLLAGGGLEFYAKNKRNVNYGSIDLLVWEPQLNFETELFKWLHADAGVSYRIISSYSEFRKVTKDDLQGLSFLLTFKFGAY